MLTRKEVDEWLFMIADDRYTKTGKIQQALETIKQAMDKLTYILPMAKGYAAEHPVGNNQEKVNGANEFVNEWEGR